MDFFVYNRDDFCGVDLANDEIKFSSEPFALLFRRARDAGMNVTIHAGEVDAERGADRVRYAAEELGAKRVGYGVMAANDERVLRAERAPGSLSDVELVVPVRGVVRRPPDAKDPRRRSRLRLWDRRSGAFQHGTGRRTRTEHHAEQGAGLG